MTETTFRLFNRLVTDSQILIAAWDRPVGRSVLALSLARAFCLASVVSLVAVGSARAASVVWNHTSGDRNWSTSGNWTGGTPGAANDIIFNNNDAQTATTPVNTVNVSYTVRSLTYTNFYTNTAAYLSFQNTAIASGKTLTVTNGLNVGVANAIGFAANPYTYVTITGTGAALNVTGGSFQVGNQSGNATPYVFDLLDMRGLDNFSYNNLAGTFGVVSAARQRQGGEVFLGGSNTVTAAEISVGIGAGGTIASNPGRLHLGATNTLFADVITVGKMTVGSLIDFQAGLTDPAVTIRAKDGVSGVNSMYLGWNITVGSGTQQSAGTNDFSGGIVDAVINNLYVGWSSATVNRYANGAFILGTKSQNVLSVANLFIGSVTNLAAIATTTSAGSFEMRGGTVTAGTVTMAQLAALGSSKGQLKLTGGTMSVTGNIVAGLGSSTGIVANASLNVAGLIGSAAQYLTALTLSNGTLGLTLLGGSNPSAFVTNLVVNAASTISFTSTTPTLGQFPLIAYDSTGGLVGVAGITLVSPVGVTATLSNNVANKTLDVVVTGVLKKLAFTTTAQTLTAGVTSGAITVQLQDTDGTPQNAASDLTVNLSSSSGTGIFRNAANTATITSVTILSGQNSASFKYNDTVAPATPTLTASTLSGHLPATQVESVVSAAASKLGFTAQPANGSLHTVLAPVVVQVQDQFGNPVAQSGTAITLTLNNAGSSALTGTNPQTTDGSGAATFNDLIVTGAPGTGFNFTATGSGLTQGTSGNFDIARRIIVKGPGNTAFNLPSSWTGGVLPGSDDIAQIDNTSVIVGAFTPDIGGNASWYGLKIIGWTAATGYGVTDTNSGGGHVVTLGAGGLTCSSATHSTSFANGFALGTDQTWTWSGAPFSLTLSGGINNGGYHFGLDVSQPVTISGPIYGAGDLTKSGTNTLTLSGTNTYSGATIISNGTLVLSGRGSISNTPAITIATNATFDVSAVTGSYADPSGCTLVFNIDKTGGTRTQGQLKIGAINLTYGGPLTVTKSGADTLADGDSFALISRTTGTLNGWFSSVSLPALDTGLVWDTNGLATSGVLDIYTFTTTPLAFSTATNTPAVITAYKMGLQATSGRGTPVAVSATTPTHGTAGVTSGALTYVSTDSFVGTDNFTVTYSDGHGLQTMAVTVTLTAANVGPALSGVDDGNNHYKITTSAMPLTTYDVQAQTTDSNVTGDWTTISSTTAAANGVVSWTDGEPIGTHQARLYRLKQQ